MPLSHYYPTDARYTLDMDYAACHYNFEDLVTPTCQDGGNCGEAALKHGVNTATCALRAFLGLFSGFFEASSGFLWLIFRLFSKLYTIPLGSISFVDTAFNMHR